MSEKSPSRREILKLMLAAGGGIAASAFLPSRWLKPVVKSGVLPVHAQVSGENIDLHATVGCYLNIDSADITPVPAAGSSVTYSVIGVDDDSNVITLTPSTGSGTTDASGHVDFSDQLDYDPISYTFPVTFTVVVTCGDISKDCTVYEETMPTC